MHALCVFPQLDSAWIRESEGMELKNNILHFNLYLQSSVQIINFGWGGAVWSMLHHIVCVHYICVHDKFLLHGMFRNTHYIWPRVLHTHIPYTHTRTHAHKAYNAPMHNCCPAGPQPQFIEDYTFFCLFKHGQCWAGSTVCNIYVCVCVMCNVWVSVFVCNVRTNVMCQDLPDLFSLLKACGMWTWLVIVTCDYG